MFTGNSDRAWERYGDLDPYFGVCVQDKYRMGRLSESTLKEFFHSGEEHINQLLNLIQQHLDSKFQPSRALDFGCGVGRLTIPLARICSYVVGIDIADSMLREARRNCLRENVASKVNLVKSDDKLSKVAGTFDLIVSFIVFQHIPPRRGLVLLEAIIDRLDANGVGVVHFTYHRIAPRAKHIVHWLRKYVPLANNVVNVIQRQPFLRPLMQWNNYQLNRIYLKLQEKGCEHVYVRFTDHGETLGVILIFQKKALPTL